MSSRRRSFSSPSVAATPTGAATTAQSFHLDFDMDFDTDYNRSIAGDGPYNINTSDDGLTSMENALRIISNYRQHQLNQNGANGTGASHDDTINCKEWLLYAQYQSIHVGVNGQMINISDSMRLHISYQDDKRLLMKPTWSHAWWQYLTDSSNHGNMSSHGHETVFNVYEYYGHDEISIQLIPALSFKSVDPSGMHPNFTKKVPLCHITKHQERYDENHRSIRNKATAIDSYRYITSYTISFQVPTKELLSLNVFLPKTVTHKANGTIIPAVTVVARLGFRIVSLRQCCRLFLFRHPSLSNTIDIEKCDPRASSVGPSASSFDGSQMNEPNQANNNDFVCERVHELHIAAAFGPPHLLLHLLQSLARKSYLRRSMQLLSGNVDNSQGSGSTYITGLIANLPKNPFDIAVAHGNYENAKILLELIGHLCFHGSLVGNRSCALHHAVYSGNPRCVALILKYFHFYGPVPSRGGREHMVRFQDIIEWRDENDFTPLLLACKLSRIPVMRQTLGIDGCMDHKEFIKEDGSTKSNNYIGGKSVGSDEKAKQTNKLIAGRTKIVELLLQFKADCGVISSKTSDTVLTLACKPSTIFGESISLNDATATSTERANIDLIRLLFRAKKSRSEISRLLQANPSLADNHSYHRLNCGFWSCFFKLPSLMSKANLPADTAVSLGSPTAPAIHLLANNDTIDPEMSYLDYNDLINSYYPYDLSSKHPHNGNNKLPLLLLKCDVFHKDQHHKTAFTYAVEVGDLAIVQLLISYGLSYMDMMDIQANNIVHYCAKYGYEDIIDYIAVLEYDRYRKYRAYIKKYPLQLICYRMKIFAAKNILGLTPFDTAMMSSYAERDHQPLQRLSNPPIEVHSSLIQKSNDLYQKIASKIAYYCHLIYGPSVRPSTTFTNDEEWLHVSGSINKNHHDSDSHEAKKGLDAANNAWTSERPFSALISMFLPQHSPLPSNTTHNIKGSSMKKGQIDPNTSSVPVNPSEPLDGMDRNQDRDDALTYDDEADDLAFDFALAPKGLPAQNYYSVASIENAKIQAKKDDESSASETVLAESNYVAPTEVNVAITMPSQ